MRWIVMTILSFAAITLAIWSVWILFSSYTPDTPAWLLLGLSFLCFSKAILGIMDWAVPDK